MKIKFLAIICLSTFLSNCTFDLQMKKEDFTLIQKEKKIAVFKIKPMLEGRKMSINPPQDWKSYCRFYFSEDGNFFSKEFYPYKVRNEYVFVNTTSPDIYLTGIECAEYRVFYNKMRFKRIGNKIFSFSNANKINYAGDIEIEWNPEIFKTTDLFLLGHLGISDKGSFAMRLTDDYNSYLDFMKNSYGFEKDKSVNATDQLLIKEPIIKLKN